MGACEEFWDQPEVGCALSVTEMKEACIPTWSQHRGLETAQGPGHEPLCPAASEAFDLGMPFILQVTAQLLALLCNPGQVMSPL